MAPDTIATTFTLAGVVVAWLVAGGSWWLYRQRAFGRARTLGHLAWIVSSVALFLAMAAERTASLFPPDGLTAPQAGLMAALSEGIVSDRPSSMVIRTVLFVTVTATAAVVGIVVVVRCKRRANQTGWCRSPQR